MSAELETTKHVRVHIVSRSRTRASGPNLGCEVLHMVDMLYLGLR